MPVTSASTDDQVDAEFEDTLGYALTADVSLAMRFYWAVGIRLSRAVGKIQNGQNAVELTANLPLWREQQREVARWLRDANALPTPNTATANREPTHVFAFDGVRE
jgi:hypothetical protein